MSKKAVRVLIVFVCLLGYCAYNKSAQLNISDFELETAWKIKYGTGPSARLNIGKGGTVLLTISGAEFIAFSPLGKELFRYQVANKKNHYGYDFGYNDTLWIATLDSPDPVNQYQPGHNNPVVPFVQDPNSTEVVIAEPPPLIARLVGISTDGLTQFDQTFEVGGIVGNLGWLDGKVYLMDAGQNLRCLDGQGSQLWVKNFPGMVEFSKGENQLFLNCYSELIALDLDGNEQWRASIKPRSRMGHYGTWSSTNSRLCVVDTDDTIHVLDIDGHEIWSINLYFSAKLGRNFSNVFARIQPDNTVYALSGNAILIKYSAAGDEMWRYDVGSWGPSRFDNGKDGTVYIQGSKTGLLAISAEGKLLWRDGRFNHPNSQYRPRVGSAGLVYLVEGTNLLALKLPGN